MNARRFQLQGLCHNLWHQPHPILGHPDKTRGL
jgi:hypothetical protein